MKEKYSKLFENYMLKDGITLKNRLVMAPMTTWSSNGDATISDAEADYYRERVKGVGLVITGCTHVAANGLGFSGEFASYDDQFVPSLKKLAAAAKSGGAPAILQIFHAGNKAIPELIPNADVVSSSALQTETTAFTEGHVQPRELPHEEILEIIEAFGEATRRAIEVGFDGVEIHGAHGFLIQNFFSPLFNQRIDMWGGSLENRMRFPLAIVEKINQVIKQHASKPFVLGFRISPEESQEGGLRIQDTYALIDRLIDEKVDYVHASLSNVLSSKPMGSQDEDTIAQAIVKHVNGRIPVLAAGFLRTPDDVDKALDMGLPLPVIGQALVMNPNWVELVQSGREDEIDVELKVSKVEQIRLPEKMWTAIKGTPGWFVISE
ncbi:NADH-dependent flavin oxidoreductase [Paenibacillus polymyxa]|uniref:NADH-dependent flavin oxidoreductase n=1 Tax=Paenibacillus polymyxa TaxID=1406 RepID=A0AAE9L771_PAEPO|nr:NADH-dependent flavin oxidoreductase [Paenibacillus polymyxa]URJ39949.1 NADH-dependent flavin oxidoreductase [Paenibacillus polymyxa]URJ49204.1 NADH-dependent flavin oxidoreductase [Paenibacillus polymyxa]